MPQINFRVRKLFRINFHQTVRSGTVIDHLRFGPNARALWRRDTTRGHGNTFGSLFTTTRDCRFCEIDGTDAREVSRLDLFVGFPVAAIANWFPQQFGELALQLWELNAILWPLGTSDTRNDRSKIEIEHRAVFTFTLPRDAKEALRLVIVAHRCYVFVRAAGGFE